MELNLHQSIQLATKAHEGQYRTPTKVFPVNQHTLTNYEITKLQQNNGTDFSICKEDGEYSMNIHLELFIAKPYITHSLEVMNMLSTEEEQIVAVLHDVFEKCPGWCLGRVMDDSKFYIKDRSENIEYITTANVYWALMLISKDKHVKYNDYIYNMIHDIKLDGAPNKLAIKVKLADILSNLSDNPSNYAKQKYAKALPILLQGI